MKDKQEDIVIFTGQSGIKIDRCIDRLQNDGLQFQVLAIDKLMAQMSGEEFVNVLGKPPRIQESLWTDAFRALREKIPKQSEKEKYTFITFHACYFHQRYTEFISPVNLNELLDLKDRIKMVIIFIDDCYDIYRRLLDESQMYEYVLTKQPIDSLLQSITNISNLLIWREVEIAFSRKIAQLLEVPVYCISVKHPSFLVSRLISKAQSDLNILYLSHPISSIRKQEMGERLSDFYTELNMFIKDVLRHENMVLFIPDTIDEYRIKVDSDSNEYIPELTSGWPLPFSEQLLCEHLPKKLQGINPLNPCKFPFSKADDSVQSAISSTLKMLSSRIKDQVNARDRTLVEQSVDGILVFRPYWAATVPSGVEQEMQYNANLKEGYDEKERKAYLLSAHQDLGKWRINQLFTLIEDSVNIDGGRRESLKSVLQQWLEDPKRILDFYYKRYSRNGIRKEIESLLPRNYRFDESLVGTYKGALAPGEMLQKAELLDKGWDEIYNQVNVEDPLVRYSNEDSILLSDQKNFAEEAKSFIEKIIIGNT